MADRKTLTRRNLLKTGIAAAAAPAIVPSSVFGQNAPSNRITIAAIGVGRISRIHDMFETFKYDHAQIVAVCDLDSNRVTSGQQFVNDIGSEGWILVTRGEDAVTPSDPSGPKMPPLTASNPKILDSVIGPNEIHLYRSAEQHGNWLDSIRSRKINSAPVEIGHRACSTCLIHQVAMHIPRRLQWDPSAERFVNDDEANKWLSRPHRRPYIF